MSTTQYLIAGFGGQGILFAGKFLAYKGLTDGSNVVGFRLMALKCVAVQQAAALSSAMIPSAHPLSVKQISSLQ